MPVLIHFVLARFSERSTWTHILGAVMTATTLHFTVAQQTELVNAAIALAALAGSFIPDAAVNHDHAPFV